MQGRRADAEKIARALLDKPTGLGSQPCSVAPVYAALGNLDRAMEIMETCYRNRGIGFRYISADPRYDSLRSDPRFKALVARVGLPQ